MCVWCVTLPVELASHAECVEGVVGGIEVRCVGHGGGEPRDGPDGHGGVEEHRLGGQRPQVDLPPPVADRDQPGLAPEGP
jgi:hypothetical protein